VFSNDFTASVWFNAYDIANGWPTLLLEENQSFLLEIGGLACGCAGPGHLISFSHYPPSPGGTFSWILDRAQQTPIGTYCQVVVTKAGTSVTMYVNAQSAVTDQVDDPTTQAGQFLTIGSDSVNDYTAFHGVIDDVRIYNRALSSSEVAQLYAIESGPRVDLIKAVKPSFAYLSLGTNYQLQVSGDMSTWTNQGAAFTATNSSMVYPQYWDVDNWSKLFFRLQVSP
jgi:hypothetical protein